MAKEKKLYRLEGAVPGISEKEIHPTLRFTHAYSRAQALKQFWDKFRRAFPKHDVRLHSCDVIEIQEPKPAPPDKPEPEDRSFDQEKLF